MTVGCTAMPLHNRSRGANECEKAGMQLAIALYTLL